MKTLTKVLLILLVSYFVAAANGASFEVFLKIDGIEGDSMVPGHENEINVVSFNSGVLNTGTFSPDTPGGGAGRTEFTDLKIIKFIDSASIPLCIAAAQGNHIRNATLLVRKSGPNPFPIYKIVLDPVIITSVNDSGTTDQNANLLESITLNWGRISWTFFPQNPDGSRGVPITRSFDRRTGRGG